MHPLPLISMQTLCINHAVRALGSPALISERCLELQKPGAGGTKKRAQGPGPEAALGAGGLLGADGGVGRGVGAARKVSHAGKWVLERGLLPGWGHGLAFDAHTVDLRRENSET
jgi:hypothetical protein